MFGPGRSRPRRMLEVFVLTLLLLLPCSVFSAVDWEDLAESNNIADNHPDIVKKIEQIMKTARTDSQEYPLFSRS